ncbi:MAG: efflux RND transporter periplasmic adaptor subunit [Deltaproteobacteria bacterium]|nr:efflux RND transporter periplasmic adaptor subunit [Deltaproteobacteria bacterium]
MIIRWFLRSLFTSASLVIATVTAVSCVPANGADATATKPESVVSRPLAKRKATRVEVAVVRATTPHLDLSIPGEVEGYRDAELGTTLGGYVERVDVKLGSRVRAGQGLASIGLATAELQVEQSLAELESVRTDLNVVEKAGASVTRARRDAATFRLRSAEARHKLAELNRDRARVRAPFAGVVADVFVELGEVLPPGGRVVRLVEVDPVKVTLSISDRDIGSLREGMDVQVVMSADSQIYRGQIAQIGPAADLKTRTFMAEVRVPNEEGRLRPGMIATVKADISLGSEALALPQYILVTRRSGNGVFVREGDVATWRPVEIGRVLRDQVTITRGVSPGDEVIVTGHRELVDGDNIIVTRQGTCCKDGVVSFGDT